MWRGPGSGEARRPGRTLKISVDGSTLELTAATEAQQQQLVEEFVRALSTH